MIETRAVDVIAFKMGEARVECLDDGVESEVDDEVESKEEEDSIEEDNSERVSMSEDVGKWDLFLNRDTIARVNEPKSRREMLIKVV